MRHRRRRGVGTIKGRGSRSMLGALKNGLGIGIAPLAGGVVSFGTTAALRYASDPIKDGRANPLFKWAPAIGMGAGLVVGGLVSYLTTKRVTDMLATGVAAILASGPILVQDLYYHHLATSTVAADTTKWAGIAQILTTTDTGHTSGLGHGGDGGMGRIVASPAQMMGVSLGGVGGPNLRIVQGMHRASYGQSVVR